jgi:hypothetical protein
VDLTPLQSTRDVGTTQLVHAAASVASAGETTNDKAVALAKAKAAALASFPFATRKPCQPPIAATDVVAVELSPSMSQAPPDPIPPKPPFDVSANPIRAPTSFNVATPTKSPKSVVTPLKWQAFQQLMKEHPDQKLVSELVHDLQFGVRVGYQGPRDQFRPSPNLPIEPEHESFIDDEIRKEVEAGRRMGPFDSPPFPNLMVSPIGVVTKKLSTKLRMIHHLSWPRSVSADSDSINEHISQEDSATTLQSFDDAVAMLANIPPQLRAKLIWLCKIDIKAAYRLVPVHPDDWHLLGMQWRGKYYYDPVLVFGLASACQQWERVATAAHWIAKHHLKLDLMIHYIDDYLLISVGSAELAETQLKALLKLFDMLGLPISLEKLEGPTHVLCFLGIQIDTRSMTVALDSVRLSYVQSLLSDWMKMDRASIQQLQSLTGTLNFCCKVIRAGRVFLRRLINLTTYWIAKYAKSPRPAQSAVTSLHPLPDSVKLDIQWWSTYMSQFNGTMSIYPTTWDESADMNIATDAGQAGYGAVFGKQWFHGTWTDAEEQQSQQISRDSMPWKELHTLVRAAATWGSQWSNHNIVFQLDCQPMVFAISKGGSKHPHIMSLLRTLSFIAAQNNFQYKVKHIAGVLNVAADHLSRGRVDVFQSLFPTSNPSPTQASQLPCHNW